MPGNAGTGGRPDKLNRTSTYTRDRHHYIGHPVQEHNISEQGIIATEAGLLFSYVECVPR